MEQMLVIKDLKRKYKSKFALNGINLTIEKGKIVGLLGPNGSGKTTLFKIMAGISKDYTGEILIEGMKPGSETKKIVSFMPDKDIFSKWMKIKDIENFYSDFFQDFNSVKFNEMINTMKLDKNQNVKALSKGMHEKLQIALTLSRKAHIYLLDEPIGGVDPLAREKILDYIIDYYDGDSTLIISTHLVKDIERLFDEVVFINNGEILLQENVEKIRIEKGKSVDELFREVFSEC